MRNLVCVAQRVCVLLALALAVLPAWAQSSSGGARQFSDAAEWSRWFDSEERDAWQKPVEVLSALALPRSAVVADIGAGTGYFSARLARALPDGKVYAVDVEPEMVRHLRDRAAAERIGNMHAVQAARDDPRLPEPVDLVLMVNVQGLMVRPGDYFARLRSMLKPGGRVAIVSTRIDSPIGARAQMRVAPEKVKQDMADQGYALVAEHDFLPYQFFLVFSIK